jgi:hypothetical protein
MTEDQMRSSTYLKWFGLLSLLIGFSVWAVNRIPNIYTDQIHVSGSTTSTVPYFDGAQKLVSSTVTPTQLGYLQTMTTTGDTIYSSDNSGTFARRAIGTNGQRYQVVSGVPTWNWTNLRSISSFPDTATLNDETMILSGASGTETLPALGNSGKVLIIKHNGTSLTQKYTLAISGGGNFVGPTGNIASGSYVLTTAGETLVVIDDGTAYQVVRHLASTGWVNFGNNIITGTTTNPVQTGNTKSSDKVWWRRNGSSMDVRIEFVQSAAGTNTAGSGDYLFQVPTNASIDTTVITAYNAVTTYKPSNLVGVAYPNQGSNQPSPGYVSVYDSTRVRFFGATANTTSPNLTYVGSVNNALTNATLSYAAAFTVPISDWQP